MKRKTYRVEVVGYPSSWYWRLVARNGKILAHSEIFANRGNAIRAARALISAELVLIPKEGPNG